MMATACWDPHTRAEGRTHYLELHGLPLEVNGADLEVDADGAEVAVRERVLREPEEQT